MTLTMRTRALAVMGAVGVLAASLLVGAAPAQAAGRDGTCDNGEFCLYYNSD